MICRLLSLLSARKILAPIMLVACKQKRRFIINGCTVLTMPAIFFNSVVLVLVFKIRISAPQDCSSITPICNDERQCQSCIRAHHCCVWCSDKNFEGMRCSVKDSTQLSNCPLPYIVNNTRTSASIKQDSTFADVEADPSQAVQFRPKEYEVNLRLGEPINITIQYQPARNYPLDLYYLMDLTRSMQPDLTTITQLGLNLGQLLKELTQNHQIAFGSYIDKPAMPFYTTDEQNYRNPCHIENQECEMGYLFKHKLNFTTNIERFIEQVNKSRVSANLDNLEGGMDALMQILLCGSAMGWSIDSRKLVIIATDGRMHLAGDGLLSGSTIRNKDKCLIDSQGNHMSPTLYDYPSLEEIHHRLKGKKTNVIIAAKDTISNYYKKMYELMPDATFVGELRNDSTNILELVQEGYYAFMRQVTLNINTTEIDGLQVDFFADCDGNNRWRKTDTCSNAEEGKAINFTVQFLLDKYQETESKLLFIEESKINEKIAVNVNFVGSKCDCPMIESTKTCVHGEIDCGNCSCSDGWVGETCEVPCDNNLSKCRFEEDGEVSLTCFGRGDCICSKCDCYFPYSGAYCQYECPYEFSTNRICGGHGKCSQGKCQCYDMYSGEDCTCFESQEACKIPGTDDLICSNNGDCECNACYCQEGYSGLFCEICEQCQGLCKHYEDCVASKVEDNSNNTCSTGNDTVRVTIVEKLEENKQNCLYRYKKKDETCDADYTYMIHKDRSVDVEVQEPNCYKPKTAAFYALIIIPAIVAAGLLGILIWKARSMYRDRIEYQKFMKNRELNQHSEQNPLYKSPVVTYNNPMELVNLHSKSE